MEYTLRRGLAFIREYLNDAEGKLSTVAIENIRKLSRKFCLIHERGIRGGVYKISLRPME